MNNLIDWYAIVDAVGDDADIEQFVTMPAASRLLLMELATAFYGRYNRSGLAEPQEMYKYLSTAQKALAREESGTISPATYAIRKDWGHPGIDHVGYNQVRMSGALHLLAIGTNRVIGMGVLANVSFVGAHAFSARIAGTMSSSGSLRAIRGALTYAVTGGVAFDRYVLIYKSGFLGDTTQYDSTSLYTSAKSFEDWSPQSNSSLVVYASESVFNLVTTTPGATADVTISDINWMDINGRSLYFDG